MLSSIVGKFTSKSFIISTISTSPEEEDEEELLFGAVPNFFSNAAIFAVSAS